MPAARAALKRCVCEECTVIGGYDKDGAPKGVLMAERSIASHILRVKAERTVDVDAVTTDLSACAITASVSTITDNLSRLTLATDKLVNIPSNSTVCTVELVPGRVAVADDPNRNRSPLTMDTSKPDTIPASKQRCNRRTAKAFVIFDNIESRIQQCFRLLLHSGSIDHVGRELHALRKALHNVSLKTDIIIA